MIPSPSVAIIILNWNTSHFLRRFLPSVLNTSYGNKRIYVIDNASTDDSLAVLENEFPAVNVIKTEKNIGFAAAYNLAIGMIDSDYFLIVNSDIEVTPGFIEPVVEFMERRTDIGICQPKLLSLDDRNMFEYAGASGGWIDALGYPFARGRILLSIEEDKGQYDSTEEVFWATGACMFVKSEVLRKVGGFYDYYYMHQEDIDLCWRAYNAGYRIFACPASVVYHVGGGSLSWENHLKTFLTYRNNYILLTRNVPLSRAWMILTVRLALDAIGALYFLAKGEPQISKAMIKAELAYLYWLLFKKKKFHGGHRSFGKRKGFYGRTIVIPYFLNIRKFSDLPKIKRHTKTSPDGQFIAKQS